MMLKVVQWNIASAIAFSFFLCLGVLSYGPACFAQAAGGGAATADDSSKKSLKDRGFTAARPAVGRPQPPPQSTGWLGRSYAWLVAQQRAINRQLSDAIRRLKTDNPIYAALLLGLLSFTYGVLHAAGPGHGKAVISSYVLANEQTVRRGILLSFMAALMQAVSAITIVGVLAVLLNKSGLHIRTTENWITTLSWGLVAAVGAWLLIVQLRSLFSSKPALAGHSHRGHGTHAHDHDDACCDHAHMPDPKELQGAWSWRKAFAVAFAVGIRPCTGAVLVLIFALTQGLLWAGVFATFAMSLGTALTVSVLATFAIGSREFAKTLAGRTSVWAGRIQSAAGLVGALLILLLGTAFFIGSLSTTAPF